MRIILLIAILFFSVKILSQNQYLSKKDRSFFSNEIFVSGNGFWNLEVLELGVGYERTIFRLKNKKTDYFSWQNEAMFEVPEISNFSFRSGILQSIFKYNHLNKFSIYSAGVGGAVIRTSYFNPLVYAGYKYYVKRSKITIGIYGELIYDWRNHQQDTANHIIPYGGAPPYKATIWNWWGGITIGKYF